MLLQTAQKISTERTSNLNMMGAVKIVRDPQTRKVTLLRMATYFSDSDRSFSMTNRAGGMAPESRFMKKLEASSVSTITCRLAIGTSSRSCISFRSIDEPVCPPMLLVFLSIFNTSGSARTLSETDLPICLLVSIVVGLVTASLL